MNANPVSAGSPITLSTGCPEWKGGNTISGWLVAAWPRASTG